MSDRSIVREPIYQQVNQLLRALAGGSEFPIGAKFLTEREICVRFQVSRATANKALSNLVAEGLLEFKKGIGTFVRGSRGIDLNLRALVSYTDEAMAAGKHPSTRVLRFSKQQARRLDASVRVGLRLEGDAEVIQMRRLRLADRVPVILETRYVVAAHCPGLKRSEAAGSIYRLWMDKYKLAVESADQTIRAMNLGAEDAAELGVKKGSAALLVTAVGYLAGGSPLWLEHTLYRADTYAFVNRLGAIHRAAAPLGKFLG